MLNLQQNTTFHYSNLSRDITTHEWREQHAANGSWLHLSYVEQSEGHEIVAGMKISTNFFSERDRTGINHMQTEILLINDNSLWKHVAWKVISCLFWHFNAMCMMYSTVPSNMTTHSQTKNMKGVRDWRTPWV